MSQTYSAVIIDDNQGARLALRQDLLEVCPEIKVVGEADGVVSGAKMLRQLKPELVFLDIQMPDGTGFDLLEVMGEAPFRVIFTTAHDGFAIQAFRAAAIDYLLKPINPEELRDAVTKAVAFRTTPSEQVETLLRNVQDQGQRRLALHTMEKIHVVKVEEILRCESSANYTIFHLVDKRQLLVTKTLKEFDQMLVDQGFARVHQSHLVNLAYIKEFVKADGGYLVMRDSTHVPVSSRKRAQVMQLLSEW